MVDSAESTIVGESILITGSLSGDEDLTVLGRVEGSIGLSRTLVVAETGVVKAEVSVRNAVISGIVVGNITASDSVEVTDSGRLVGDIKAPRVIIVAGARVRGAVDMGDLEAPRSSGPLPARTITSSSLARSPSASPSMPQRRATPPPPPPRRPEPMPAPRRPMATATAAPASSSPAPTPPTPKVAEPESKAAEPETKAAEPELPPTPKEAEPAEKPAMRKAPVAARKIKKKVVVKKKG